MFTSKLSIAKLLHCKNETERALSSYWSTARFKIQTRQKHCEWCSRAAAHVESTVLTAGGPGLNPASGGPFSASPFSVYLIKA